MLLLSERYVEIRLLGGVESILESGPIPINIALVYPLSYVRRKRRTKAMGMEVHLNGLDDEYIGSSDIEDPPPDILEWNGRMFRKSMECDNEYIQVSYICTIEQ